MSQPMLLPLQQLRAGQAYCRATCQAAELRGWVRVVYQNWPVYHFWPGVGTPVLPWRETLCVFVRFEVDLLPSTVAMMDFPLRNVCVRGRDADRHDSQFLRVVSGSVRHRKPV